MTQIFENYESFLNREDKEMNGVSPEFSVRCTNWEVDNETNKGCWNCSGCSGCSDCSGCSYCSDCSGCSYCSYCRDCSGCSYCSYCRDCRDCSYCSYCRDCRDCSGCSDCSYCSYCRDCRDCSYKDGIKNEKYSDIPKSVPVVENLHQKVYESIQNEGKLDMAHWHNDESINQEGAHCGTTHCWAGWIVALAGTEGRKLEEHLGTPVAALRILHASSPIHIGMVRFFETDNEKAMQEIKRCAEAEAQLPK